MKQRSALNRGILLDWLCYCEERGEPFPTDEQIARRFQFQSPELSRTLLADLSDLGKITIHHSAAGRSITIGKARPHVIGAAKPERRIEKKRAPDVDRAVARIMDIMRGRHAEPVKAPPPSLPPRPAPQTIPTPKHVPPPVMERVMPASEHNIRKQINFTASGELLGEIERRRLPGEAMTTTARRLVEEYLLRAAPDPEPATIPLEQKPMVRIEVLHAARAAGTDLHSFVGQLIAIGLETWQARGQR